MKTDTTEAIETIRAKLKLKRLNPRRLFAVDDGAYTWIGDRADLTAADARKLAAINAHGRRPDLHARDGIDSDEYTAICGGCRNIASTCGSGLVAWDDLPEDWQDGSALGPIEPL